MQRIDQAPIIEVHVIKSGEAPGGIGETGVTAGPPPLRTAIQAATGVALRRHRSLKTARIRVNFPVSRDLCGDGCDQHCVACQAPTASHSPTLGFRIAPAAPDLARLACWNRRVASRSPVARRMGWLVGLAFIGPPKPRCHA
jgi:hypothetical protein